jgi:hypothetical protein
VASAAAAMGGSDVWATETASMTTSDERGEED